MKIAVLSFQPLRKKALKEELRLVESARKLGYKAQIIRADKCQLVYDSHHPEVLFDGKKFPDFDVIIPRASVLNNVELKLAIVKQFQLMGFPVVNTFSSITKAKNKLRTLQILDHFDIPIPKTLVIRDIAYLADAIKKVGGLPVIMKTPFGSYGSGVVIAESKRAVSSSLDFLWKTNHETIILIQEYVKEAKGKDLRVFVVGDRVVGSMKRSAQKGEFRSNLELGGQGSAEAVSEEEADIAIRATKALRLDVAGVDIMRSKAGPVVLEVNANPGFKGLEDVTGVDIGMEIINFAVQKSADMKSGTLKV